MRIKKIAFFLLSLWVCIWVANSALALDYTLFRIDRSLQEQRTEFQFIFSRIPEYEVNTSGQRVDVILHQTQVDEAFRKLEADQDLARTLVAEQEERTIVSLVFRRPPRDVEYSTSETEPVLELEVAWREERELSRPSMASPLEGQLSVTHEGLVMERDVTSPYVGNWERFLREYELPIRVEPEPKYTLPDFAEFVPRQDKDLLPEQALQAGEEGWWERARQALSRNAGDEEPERVARLRSLLEAYLLLQQDKARASEKVRELSPQAGHAQPAGAKYLRAYAAGAEGNPEMALLLAEELAEKEDLPDDLLPYVHLLRLEAALDAGRAEMALELARQVPEGGFARAEAFDLRQAQAEYEAGTREEAVDRLREFSRNTLRSHPTALDLLARHSYETGDYGRALYLFTELAQVASSGEAEAMAEFGAAMANLERNSRFMARHELDRIRRDHPETLARWRAQTVLTDMELLHTDGFNPERLASSYEEAAEEAQERKVREEAAFKRILVAVLDDHPHRAVQWLGPFLRQFHAGEITPHAQALLVELLPGVCKDLMAQGKYIRALSLVQRHRETLLHATLPLDFLDDLGSSFYRFGLFDRAVQVYEYMMALVDSPGEREELYPRLVRSYLQQGNLERAERSSEHYLDNYPEGEQRKEIYALWVRALKEAGRVQRAIRALQEPDRPVSSELDALAGELFYSRGSYDQAERYLARSMAPDWSQSSGKKIMMRAESLFRLGHYEQALPMYAHLSEEDFQPARARYRQGQALLRLGRQEEGAKLLLEVVEEEEKPLWQDLAREALAVRDLL